MKKKSLLWIAAASVVVLGIGLFAATSGSRPAAQTVDKTVDQTAENAVDETPAAPEDTAPATGAASETESDTGAGSSTVTIDAAAALADRALGDPAAPVRIDEYASLTCSHCADFSKQTFDKLRTAYIDTGKVYFVYHDFPLNAPALDAASIARCLPEERYFSFIKYLFDSQDKWSKSDYKTTLRQNARLVGMSDSRFDACLANETLKTGLVDKMQKATAQYDISSTPTFVFNGGEGKMSGAQPFEKFQETIDKLITEKAGAE